MTVSIYGMSKLEPLGHLLLAPEALNESQSVVLISVWVQVTIGPTVQAMSDVRAGIPWTKANEQGQCHCGLFPNLVLLLILVASIS